MRLHLHEASMPNHLLRMSKLKISSQSKKNKMMMKLRISIKNLKRQQQPQKLKTRSKIKITTTKRQQLQQNKKRENRSMNKLKNKSKIIMRIMMNRLLWKCNNKLETRETQCNKMKYRQRKVNTEKRTKEISKNKKRI